MAKHPVQPVVYDEHGTIRFKANNIVRYLLDNGGIDLNHIAIKDFSEEDRVQFAQLIGYSVGGFSELNYVSDKDYAIAEELADELRNKKPKNT